MLCDFKTATYRVELTAGEKGLIMPSYKGATIRGAFGTIFRRIACATKMKECNSCVLKGNCAYAYIFETSPPAETKVLSKNESVSRPFVIEPPLEKKTDYMNGETFSFELVLIGRAIAYLPYFILAFKELGEIGIGKLRNPFVLERFVAIQPFSGMEKEIYSRVSDKVLNIDLTVSGKDAAESTLRDPQKQVNINFLTMTRIKHNDMFVRRIEFHVLIRALLRRFSSLYYFHHGEELKADFTQLVEKASTVNIAASKTEWVDWERYSQRQGARLNMGGVVGQVSYYGDIDEFLPILRLGEIVHVGKSCTFGMGKYQMY